MQNYPNYPNYSQQYQMFQPQMYGQMMPQQMFPDRFNQNQQLQANLQPQVGLNGKIVDSLDSITASDVPMDGNFAVFPKRDMSQVYIKYWTGDGKIATITLEPIQNVPVSNLATDNNSLRFDDLNDVLERLTNKVDTLSSRVEEALKPKTSQKSRKEVNGDE